MSAFFDPFETRSPAEREAALLTALPQQIAHAKTRAPAFTAILKGIDAQAVTSRAVSYTHLTLPTKRIV